MDGMWQILPQNHRCLACGPPRRYSRAMKLLHQPANAVEGHMLADLLRQQGIASTLLGEHLQGAIGELPAAGLVRLMVAEEDHETTRAPARSSSAGKRPPWTTWCSAPRPRPGATSSGAWSAR